VKPISFLLTVLLSSCLVFAQRGTDLSKQTIVDLTYPFDSSTVYWPTAERFQLEKDFDGETEQGFYYSAYRYAAAEHGGTHIDAPVHFSRGKNSVEQIPLKQLIAPGVVVDVTTKTQGSVDYQITTADLLAWERRNGRIPRGAILLLRTGFGQYYPDPKRYLGTANRGPEAVKELHFPGLHPDAARWLTRNRSIKAVGLDTPSIDYGQSKLFESHQILFEQNIPALENVANLDKLPLKGFLIVALPMKIKGGSGAPLRIIALL